MWIKEWRLLQRSVVVIDGSDRIVYIEYVTDQMSEPDYAAAIEAVQRAAGQSYVLFDNGPPPYISWQPIGPLRCPPYAGLGNTS